MKSFWRLIAFGVVAFLFFLIVTLPADVVLPRMRSRGIVAAGVSGSIWNGRAALLQIGNSPLGATTWNVHVFSLLAGKLSADVKTKRDDGSAQGQVRVGFGKKVVVKSLSGSMPVAALGGLGLPGGWQGTVRIQIAELELENNWPVRAKGSIEALNLIGPAYQPTALGNYRVEFVESDPKTGGIKGKLVSTGDGPLDVNGTLTLSSNRTYFIEAQVATRATAPANISKALQYLGPPDAQGRRPLSLSGSL